jgi:hypothetical protein
VVPTQIWVGPCIFACIFLFSRFDVDRRVNTSRSPVMSDTMERTSEAAVRCDGPEMCRLDGHATDQATAPSAKASGKRVRTGRARPEREAKQRQRQADREHAAVQAKPLREQHDAARQTKLAHARQHFSQRASSSSRASSSVRFFAAGGYQSSLTRAASSYSGLWQTGVCGWSSSRSALTMTHAAHNHSRSQTPRRSMT